MCKILHAVVFKRGIILFLTFLLITFPICISTSKGYDLITDHSSALGTFYPNLNFSTFLGGNDSDTGLSIAVSSDGSCYVTGNTISSNFPTFNAYNSSFGGSNDAFIAKFSPYGSLLWSTYLGGSCYDTGIDITVASDGSCYVIGFTSSYNFPTLNALNSAFCGGDFDIFIAKFSTSGSLLWSTYFGGYDSDYGFGIAAMSDGCYVTGLTYSENFPTLNAYDNIIYDQEAFVAKFSTNGALLWSTFLGGSSWDSSGGIATSDDGNCYITGNTFSSDFPTLNAFNSTFSGVYLDAFVAKFSASGSLLWSTFLGGNNYDSGSGIAVAIDESCYVTGDTASSNFPTLNAYYSTYGGSCDAFIAKFNTIGSMLWSTFMGGNSSDSGNEIAVTSGGSCFVTGDTDSSNFPTLNANDSSYNGCNDAFIAKFSVSGSLLWSTFLGGNSYDSGYGIAVTNDGSCYLTGTTQSSNFPIINAYQNTYGGDSGEPWPSWGDVYITKLIEKTTPNEISAYGFLPFIVVLPILVLALRKRRK